MSYYTKIVLKDYEKQVLHSVIEHGVGIVRGGAITNMVFRFRSFINIKKVNLGVGVNFNGDVVVWDRSRGFVSSNEATLAVEGKVAIVERSDIMEKKEFTREDMLELLGGPSSHLIRDGSILLAGQGEEKKE